MSPRETVAATGSRTRPARPTATATLAGDRADVQARERARAGRQVTEREPDRDRQEDDGEEPQRERDDGLEDRQRERHEDIDDVAPPGDVDEDRQDELAQAGAGRPVGVRMERPRIRPACPSALESGDEPRAFDREGDEQEPDPGDEERRPRRQETDDRGERGELHPEADEERREGGPRGGVERGEEEVRRPPLADAPRPRRPRGRSGSRGRRG